MNSTLADPFSELFLRHQKDVFAYILTLAPDRNDAADIYQQTCLALLEKQEQYDPGRAFFPWACGFALNEVRRFRRAHHRERMQLSDAVIESLASVQLKSASQIEGKLDLLMDCLESLPADKRETLMQCYAHRGGMRELAVRLALDPNTLYKRLERTRKTLMECMERTR
jgi:RNA polymerase sigma-70 factor, ECF subfamily